MTKSTKAHIEANIRYAKKAYKRVPLDLQNDFYEELKTASENVGESVNGYIKKAIIARMKKGK